jgi:hypothetical protein
MRRKVYSLRIGHSLLAVGFGILHLSRIRSDRECSRCDKRKVALILVALALAFPARAFDIIGIDGLPMGGLEPWGTPAAHTEAGDAGMIRRLTDILRPPIERLDQSEQRITAVSRSPDPIALVDALTAGQVGICEDIVALLGTLQKHRREIATWKLGAQAERIGVSAEGFGLALLMQALTPDKAPEEAAAAGRWTWCAAAWMPFEAAFDFQIEQDRMLRNLGFDPPQLAADPAWARGALILTLRQIEEDAGLLPAGGLRTLLETGEAARAILAFELGQRAVNKRFDERIDALVARRSVLALFRADLVSEWELEAGEYNYLALRSDSEEAVRQGLGRGLLTRFLQGAFRLQGRGADEIIRAHAVRHAMYTLLETEQAGRRAATGALTADRLYRPYLMLLAAFPPSLSPYRPTRVNDRWIAFVEDENAPPAPAARRTGADPGGDAASVPQGVTSLLFLLQADCFSHDGKTWEWRPRAACSRRHLDRLLDALTGTAAAAPRTEERP